MKQQRNKTASPSAKNINQQLETTAASQRNKQRNKRLSTRPGHRGAQCLPMTEGCEGVLRKGHLQIHCTLSKVTGLPDHRSRQGNLSHCPVLSCLLYMGNRVGPTTQDVSVSWGGESRHRQKISSITPPTEANKELA